VGADQLPLPHLGPQARVLLDRIVASGYAGVERRETQDWLLSRLIELRYAEESPLNTSAVVCTQAGRRRWQIEMLADEQRAASEMRRELIRYRVDERLSNFAAGQSTALTITYPPMTPQLYGGVPQRSPRRTLKARLKPALATLFAAAAAALVVLLGDTEPQDRHVWLAPPPHAVAAPDVVAKVTVAAIIARPPIDRHADDTAATVVPTDVAAVIDAAIARTRPLAAVLHRMIADVEQAAPGTSAIADARVLCDAAIRDAVQATAAVADATMRAAQQLAGDLLAGVKAGVRPVAAALLQAASATEVAVATAPAPEPPPVAIARITTPGHTVTKTPAPHVSEDDSQHAVVERLNALSLAAARRGVAWRPSGARDVAQAGRPPWR